LGGIVLLAALIFGVSALSHPKGQQPRQLAPVVRADKLASEAQIAISQGETETARSLARQALKLDATNSVAKRVLDRVDASSPQAFTPAPSSPGQDPSSPTSSPVAPTPPGVYDAPIKDLSTLLPAALDGWSAGNVVVNATDAQVTFQPGTKSPDYSKLKLATFYVHDRTTAEKAAKFVDSVDRKVYPVDGADAVLGAVSGYTGSDGKGLYVFAFARGRFAFEVVVSAKPGVTSGLSEAAQRLAAVSPAVR
jgi:hypothetical protein